MGGTSVPKMTNQKGVHGSTNVCLRTCYRLSNKQREVITHAVLKSPDCALLEADDVCVCLMLIGWLTRGPE